MSIQKQTLKTILKRVIVGHIIAILCLSLNFKKRKSKVIVTNTLKENVRLIAKPKTPKAAIKKKALAASKKVTTLPTKKKAVIKNKTVKSKKELPQIKPIEKVAQNSTLELKLPKPVGNLQIEKEASYYDETEEPYATYLGQVIKEKLELKPNAFVSFEFKLNSQGEVLFVQANDYSDLFSKDFIIENIKRMRFAHFFGERANSKEYTFYYRTEGTDE